MAYFERDNSGTLAAMEIARRTRETEEFKTIRAALVDHIHAVMAEAIQLDPVEQVAYLRARGGISAIIVAELERLVGPLPAVPAGTMAGSPLWERHNLGSQLRMEVEPIRCDAQCWAASEITRRNAAGGEVGHA
jgi:hypothetical protein